MAEKVSPLANSIGTAMHLLFQNKIAAIQGQPPAKTPETPPIKAPTNIGSTNPATAATATEQAQEAAQAKTAPTALVPPSAASLLFPANAGSAVGNNTSAAGLLKLKA